MKIRFVTLGCKLNFAESSALGKVLLSRGHQRALLSEVPDLCVVNTCSVTDAADHKDRQAINQLHRKYPNAIIVVTGCYAQLQPEQISHIEGVDYVLGQNEKYDIPALVEEIEQQLLNRPLPNADCPSPIANSQSPIANTPSPIICTDFVSQMPLAYALADLVISRAGASSISELCLLGKPSILVPSPNVAEDHQTHNAMALVKKQAAVLVKDNNAHSELIATALQLIADDQQLQELHTHILTLALPDSARMIAAEVMQLAQKK